MSEARPQLPVIPGFRLRKILGRGGMATVFLAEPEGGGQKVAVKVMQPPQGDAREWSARFLREAALLQRFDHPNIIRVFAAGESRGDHYMVMEYLDHGDLTTWIRQGLQPEDALRLLRQLALALDYAHNLGCVHRDVKPDNVLFRADGTAVLTDFGIARRRGSDPKLTQVGMAIGTPSYMSPEQHKGLEVDGRTDLYALGIVFHEMLTRRVPYDGADSMTIGIRHLQDPLPELPPEHARFQRFLDTLLAKDPAQRFARGATVVKAIDLLLEAPAPSAKLAVAARQALQRGLDVRETETKTGLFSKAMDIAIDIGAEDWDAFQQRLNAAVQALVEWHREAGKKARHVTLQCFVHPWIASRARGALRGLAANADLAFLARQKAVLRLLDEDGVPVWETVAGSEQD